MQDFLHELPAFRMPSKKILRLWSRAPHSAFTDLCAYRDNVYCCFREAQSHVSDDGSIRVLRLSNDAEVLDSSSLSFPDADLRDPKMTITPDGRLLLTAYARFLDISTGQRVSRNVSWFSVTGRSWSSIKQFGEPFHWVWRLRWHKGRAYGLAYRRSDESLHLFSGDPRRTFECVKRDVLSLARHGVGYPNESDLMFNKQGRLTALVRRDADTGSTKLGSANPPYTRWHWLDLGTYIGGPVMLPLAEDTALVAGREWQSNGPRTVLWQLNLVNGHLEVLDRLPSSGDNSYPGLVAVGNELWVSYYSSHQDNKSCIYLARYPLALFR